jgi:spermidine/putrescine-binding protein
MTGVTPGGVVGERMSRRRFLGTSGRAALGIAAAAALGACADADRGDDAASQPGTTAGTQDFKGEALTMLVYSGITEQLYKRHFVPQFEAATGARVTIDAAWTEGIARLQAAPAGNPPFDAVLTDPTQGLPAIRAGLFQQFDVSRLTNAKRFAPRLLEAEVWKQGYGLPFHSSAMTLATNTSLRPEPYRTWLQLLTDPPREGVMLYNLPYISVYTFAAMKAEQEGRAGSAAQMLRDDPDSVMRFAVANRGLVKYFWTSTTDGMNALLRGEVAAGNMHGNGLLAPKRDGKPVAGVIPPGDVGYAQLFFTIPQNVRNLDLSVAAVNHVASPEFQSALAGSGEYSCAIPELAAAQAAKDPEWAAAFPHTPEDFAALSYYPYEALANESITRTWEREVLRKG